MGVEMRCLAFTAILICFLASGSHAAEDHPGMKSSSFGSLYSLVGDFPLGRSTNRTDYESVDPVARKLYIAKMGAGKLLVFDIDRNKLTAQLDGFPKITGVLVVPGIQRIYSSIPGAGLTASIFVGLGMAGLSSGRGAVAILDMKNLSEIARLPGGVFPDGIAYDSKDHRVFVSDELGSAVTVINADSNQLIDRVVMGGEVGNVQYDSVTAKVYAPIQSQNKLAVIDPIKAKIITHYTLDGCNHPHGLAIMPATTDGYIACDGNDRLLTIDLATGKILNTQPVAHDPDVMAIDPIMKRLYVASESGNLSSFGISKSAAPTSLGDIFIGENAHSLAVDTVSHRLYFALADVNGQSILRVLAPK